MRLLAVGLAPLAVGLLMAAVVMVPLMVVAGALIHPSVVPPTVVSEGCWMEEEAEAVVGRKQDS